MAKELNVVVKAVTVRNNTRNIYVANGYIYNIVGIGATAGAQLTPIDEATNVELYNALGPDDNNNIPLAASLGQMADFTQFGEEEKYLLTSPKEVSAEEPKFTPKPWGNSLDEEVQNQNCENKGFDSTKYKVDTRYFDKVVDYLIHCKGEDFLKFACYAKTHNNIFPRYVDIFANIINADDAYCSAIIKITRHLGETVEKRAFELFDAATNDKIEANEFLNFWKALQIINFC